MPTVSSSMPAPRPSSAPSTDELTATFNRRRFAQIATETLASTPGRCGLLLLDADHFKQINDAYGHAVGDAVLVDLAQRLSAGLEPGDCLARWGGEEFAVLLPGVASNDELVRRAERLRLAVNESPIVHGDVRVELTISVGCALAADGSQTLDALLDTADSCLYAAKHEGRDRVSLLPSSTDRRAHRPRSPRPSAWPAPWRSRAASGRASRRSTPSRSRAWPF